MRRSGWVLLLTVLLPVGTASAQDYVPGFDPGIAQSNINVITTGAINKAVFANAFYRGDFGDGKRPRGKGRSGRPSSPNAATGLISGAAASRVASGKATNFPYQFRNVVAQQAKADFLKRLEGNSPSIAAEATKELGRHDLPEVYANLTEPFGLSPVDAGDIMTAYIVLGWLVANNVDNPPPGSVAAVRASIGATLARGGQIADPSTRAMIAEEIKILFVVLHAGWQAARKEAKLAQYADGAADYFRTATGDDLRQFSLGSSGFMARPR